MISSGPRSGFLVLTLASVHGLRLAVAAWKSGSPGRRHRERLVELLGLVLADRVREGVAELLVRERHRATAVERVAEHRRGRLAAPRSAAAARRGTAPDRSPPRRPRAAAGEDLRQQAAEGVPDDRRLLRELADHVLEVIGDLADRLAGEHLRMGVRLVDGLGIVGPARRERRVTRLLEELRQRSQLLGSSHRPWTKTTGVWPDALAAFDLGRLVLGDRHRDVLR